MAFTLSPTSVTGHTGGKDPISLKKLQCGDAQWNPNKEIQGFLVDGEVKRVQISNSRAHNILS
jgi:hypothetical protein